MARTTIRSEDITGTIDLSSKTVTLPAASVTAHVTATDIKPLENNIALMGFYRAIDNNKAVYEMQDVVIDNFEDATGVTSSTNGNRDSTGEYYSLEGDGTFGNGDSITIDWTVFAAGGSSTSAPDLENGSTSYSDGYGGSSNW